MPRVGDLGQGGRRRLRGKWSVEEKGVGIVDGGRRRRRGKTAAIGFSGLAEGAERVNLKYVEKEASKSACESG